MGSSARHDGSAMAIFRRRIGAWVLIMLGLAVMFGMLLAPVIFALNKLLDLVAAHAT